MPEAPLHLLWVLVRLVGRFTRACATDAGRGDCYGAKARRVIAIIANNVTDEETFHYGTDVPLLAGARFGRLDAPRTITFEGGLSILGPSLHRWEPSAPIGFFQNLTCCRRYQSIFNSVPLIEGSPRLPGKQNSENPDECIPVPHL